MRMTKLYAACAAAFLCLGMGNAYAAASSSEVVADQQQSRIHGTVVDAQGVPVPGASVIVKGTTNGTMTDGKGVFTLSVRPGATLEVSCIGYVTVQVAAGDNLKIVLEDDAEMLTETVVVGYGTQKKANLTGAVASVNVSETLEARPIPDVGRGLQGAAPGLNVRIMSAEVGAEPVMRIRGQFASIQGSSSPLILLDNVEIPSIQLVNPDDIESISVLKDAASASIYGAKAAFGVILITTKKGSSEKDHVRVSYNGNFAFQNLAEPLEIGRVNAMHYTVQAFERTGGAIAGYPWHVNRQSYLAAVEWEKQFGSTIGADDPMVYGRDYYYDGANVFGIRTYNPAEYMIRKNAPSQNHSISVAGNKGRTDYNFSAGYMGQTGQLKDAKADDFQRWNANARVNTKVNDWLSLRAGLMFSKTLKRWPNHTTGFTNDAWLYLYRWSSMQTIAKEDSNGYEMRSPAYEVKASNTGFTNTNYTSANVGTTITPLPNWDINIDYTYAVNNSLSHRPGTRFYAGDTWSNPSVLTDENGVAKTTKNYWNDFNGLGETIEDRAFIPAYYTSKGSGMDFVQQSSSLSQRSTLNITSNYSLDLQNAHHFNFLLGVNRVAYDYTDHWAKKMELMDYTNAQFNLATGTMTNGGDYSWNSQLGFFGRVNYNYKEKYLLEGNLRYDGSSKFPSALKWRWFPSFSAGWRVTEEPWMEPVKPVLTNMKLRASWGTIGDQTVPGSQYIATMAGSTISWIHNGAKDTKYATPSPISSGITWQDIETLDFGVDFSLFNDFAVTFDWYRRNTNGMIVPGPGVAYTYGAAAPKANVGSLRTNGWELSINWGHRFDNGLSLTASASLADAKTIITKYGDVQSIDDWYVGKTYGEIWGFRVDRLYQNDDFARDANGNLIRIEANDPSNPSDYQYAHYQTTDPNAPLQGRYNASNAVMFGPGDVKYKDLDGDGKITEGSRFFGVYNEENDPDHPERWGQSRHGDLEVIGNTTPRYEYSFRIAADYKGFDLSMFFQGIGKRDMWGSSSLSLAGFNSSDGAMAAAFANDFWYEEFDSNGNLVDSNYNAFYPRAYNMGGGTDAFNMKVSDRYLLNMAYLRLKNVTFGYTLPKKLVRKVNIENLRVYVSLENLFTFDHLKGLPIDPEEVAGVSSILSSSYNQSRAGVGAPAFKSASFGVQLTF